MSLKTIGLWYFKKDKNKFLIVKRVFSSSKCIKPVFRQGFPLGELMTLLRSLCWMERVSASLRILTRSSPPCFLTTARQIEPAKGPPVPPRLGASHMLRDLMLGVKTQMVSDFFAFQFFFNWANLRFSVSTLFSCCVHEKKISGVQGRAPGQGVRGKALLKLKHF